MPETNGDPLQTGWCPFRKAFWVIKTQRTGFALSPASDLLVMRITMSRRPRLNPMTLRLGDTGRYDTTASRHPDPRAPSFAGAVRTPPAVMARSSSATLCTSDGGSS